MKKLVLAALILLASLVLVNAQDGSDNPEGKIIDKIILKGLIKAKKREILSTMMTKEGMPLDLSLLENDYQALMGLDSFEDIDVEAEEAVDEKTGAQKLGMINVVFTFIEKSSIRKILFKGNKSIGYGFLVGDVSIKRGEFENKAKIITDIASIEEKYREKGFNYAKVSYELKKQEKNKVDLIFVIDEGTKSFVKEIIFSGNDSYSEFTLKGKMKTKERKFLGLQKGVFLENQFYEDIEGILKYYKDNGYFKAEIEKPEINRNEVEGEEGELNEEITIVINVKEGLKYRFGGMVLDGNKVFSEEDLTYSNKLRVGQVFNYTKFQEDLYNMQKRYNDYGYVETRIDRVPVINDEEQIISFKIIIVESARSYIEAVYFRGNEKTKEYVMDRVVATRVGEIFNFSNLMMSYYNLRNLGFFSNVEWDIQPGSSPGLLKIVYVVEEQSTAELKFGLQITTSSWPPEFTLFGEIGERNFVGRQIAMSGKVDLSIYRQSIRYSLDDPWFLNFPWSLGATVEFAHNWHQKILKNFSTNEKDEYMRSENLTDPDDIDIAKIREYYHEEAGANNDETNNNYLGAEGSGSWHKMGIHDIGFTISARTGYRFLRYFSVTGDYSFNPSYSYLPYISFNDSDYGDYINDVADESYRMMLARGWSIKSKISSTFAINTTKRRINPYEGLKFSQNISYTWGHFDSVSLNTRFTYYLKMMDLNFDGWVFNNVLAFNAGMAFLFPGFRNFGGYLDGESTEGAGPILGPSDYLTVDGFFMGRGWGASIGAPNFVDRFSFKRGYARFDASIEYRVPIHPDIIWLAAFVDMVNLVEGPTANIDGKSVSDPDTAWMWWNQHDSHLENDRAAWYSLDKWYGSIGLGVQLTIPQLPLSFYVVKRFKVSGNGGFEWVGSSPEIGNIDFVISIVGMYF